MIYWGSQRKLVEVDSWVPELHDYSVVVEFEASADKGKTAAAVATVFELVNRLGYRAEEVHSNIWLDLPGYHRYNDAGFRVVLRDLLKNGVRHQIMLGDEIDSVYPSRNFKDKLQTAELLKLNQMTKTENWFLFTRHLGSSVDKLIRDCTNISVSPVYDADRDVISCEIINAVDCEEESIFKEVYPAHKVFPLYHRWEPTG